MASRRNRVQVGEHDARVPQLLDARADQVPPARPLPGNFGHAALQAEAEYQQRHEAHNRGGAISVAARGHRLESCVLQPLGERRYQAGRKYDAQGVEGRTEADHAAARGLGGIVVLDRGRHRRRRRYADPEDHSHRHQLVDFRGPGIHRVAEPDHADAQHDDRAASYAVGQNAERPDQHQAHDFRNQRELAGDPARYARIGYSQVLDQNIGLGEVHVRDHPDADQGRVHVGPEVRYAHTRRQLDVSYAPAGGLFVHGFPSQ